MSVPPPDRPASAESAWPAAFRALTARRRVLMLQGPMGDFFSHLARLLQGQGSQVTKVHFNGGDQVFWRHPGALRYNGTPSELSAWLRGLMHERRIDALVLFGQMRPSHCTARAVARQMGVEVFVFEEGYLRPDYVTIERRGVNALSRQPRVASFYNARAMPQTPGPLPTRQNIWRTARLAAVYGLAAILLKPWYWRQRHHRSLNPITEPLRWLRGALRYAVHAWQERGALPPLLTPERHKRWFLVPLQVRDDSQVRDHSRFRDMQDFLDEVVASFAAYAPAHAQLVIKHHPMDRAYTDYARCIAGLAQSYGVHGRLLYLHDQHLPTLLQHARGVITVNSTVGLQALFHGTPVITLGESVYQIPGLVFGGSLDSFWNAPGEVDRPLFAQFRAHLVASTQLNASFYARRPALESLPLPARRPQAPVAVAPAGAAARSERFRGRKIQLDLRAVRVEAEQLPGPGAALLSQVVFHASRIEALLHGFQALGRKRHVVDHAGARRRHRTVGVDVQNSLAVRVQPGAGESEIGPMAVFQAEQADIEVQGALDVFGDHGEVVQANDHGRLLSGKRRAGRRFFEPMGEAGGLALASAGGAYSSTARSRLSWRELRAARARA
ncbi:MAG: capsular biosynthesis protein [Burkholderiaceae bacterium]